jgi:membrane-associated protein
VQQLLDIFLHLNEHLAQWAQDYGTWIYAILFLVVFCETGLVVTPFLPGDSLLFAVGALAGAGTLRIEVAAPLLLVAAVLGNTSNYWIGKATGPKIFTGESTSLLSKLLSRKHLESASRFFAKHGGKAVMLGQFLPIIRTFVPYVAGAGVMNYGRFIMFNVLGAVLWVGICCGAGYTFGHLEVVKKNFELVIVGIIVVSLIPVAVQVVKSWLARRAAMSGSSE